MAIPLFEDGENLPEGVHVATLREIIERLGATPPRRKALALRLERIYRLAMATGQLARFVVFGSFVTAKLEPNDVDVFLLMEDAFDVGLCAGEAELLFDHAAADAHFGASIFWMRRLSALGGERAAIEFWQTRRDGGLRGIVEIIPEAP